MKKSSGIGRWLLAALWLFPQVTTAAEVAEITTGSLFLEMIDLKGLATFPDPFYQTVQFSSYDRRSRIPGGPDWFANSDGFGKEPVPNFQQVLRPPGPDGIGEYLIADVPGPGAIVRMWSAAITGKIRLFLDGRNDPIYEGPALDFFHKPLDVFPESAALDRRRLDGTLYQRDAAYVPIPFSKSMRIIWIGDLQTIHFYQLEVRRYTAGTKVKTFKPEDLQAYAEIIDRVMTALADPDTHLMPASNESQAAIQASLKPGERRLLLELEGPKALGSLSLRLAAAHEDKALRQTLLVITCDHHPWGQVQAPVGDFFGAAPGINPYVSLPFTVKPDGTMVCRFVMPFQKHLQIAMVNLGSQPVRIMGSAQPIDFSWDESRSMHFRSRWRVDHDMIADPRAVQDLPFLLAHGQGVYVGTVSFLLNPNDVPTPYGSWWGEGDEKVFVDTEPFPVLFGTGSEDYYNYSWSSPDIFYFPYCGQPRNDGPGNRGFVTNFRWHILDPLPFHQSIRFYMELYSHERTPGLSYARIGYHYARPGATDDHLAVTPADVRHLELPGNWRPAARMGARNSIIYAAEDLLADRSRTDLRSGRLWAEGRLLVWQPEGEGDAKDFTFNLPEAGRYRIHMCAALTPKSGRITLELDGNPAPLGTDREVLDLYRPHRNLLRNYTLPARDLSRGQHTLTIRFAGAAESGTETEIGIDFIWIQKIEP